MVEAVSTHLMFDGAAEEAMNFYVSLFEHSEVLEVERYAEGEQGTEGSVKKASFKLAGRDFICIDSPVKQDFTFTPAISIFVECSSERE